MKSTIAFSLLFFSFSLFSQKIEFSSEFIKLSEKLGIEIFEPLESDYKSQKTSENPFHNYQAEIYSKKEKIQIRYAIKLYEEATPFTTMPHVQVTRSVTSAATNDEDAIIAFHDMNNEDIETFGADWGQVVLFRPKRGFSEREYCKMVTLFKEEKGLITIFYLFDDPNNIEVDKRYFALSFN